MTHLNPHHAFVSGFKCYIGNEKEEKKNEKNV